MDTLTRLFQDHPLVAAAASALILLVAILPITGRRLPRLIFRLISSLASVITVPFIIWRRTVLDLVSRSSGHSDGGAPAIGRRLLPVMQSVLILGGVLILLSGILAGWKASGIDRKAGHVKNAIETELPKLEIALADTRSEIAALDREWEETRECRREEMLDGILAESRHISDENALLRDYFLSDRQTKEVFSLLEGGPAADRDPEAIAAGIRGALPRLSLPPEKEWLFVRYLDNLSRETEIVRNFPPFSDDGLRGMHQPRIGTLRRTEAELTIAIAEGRAVLAIPETGANFDVFAFAGQSSGAIPLFCAFIWIIGHLIEGMKMVLSSRGPARVRQSPGRGDPGDPPSLHWAD